jgi:hypothetical protein
VKHRCFVRWAAKDNEVFGTEKEVRMKIREERGSIILTGQCVAPFREGTLDLGVYLGTKVAGKKKWSQKEEVRLEISGERFVLTENEVNGVFPAAGSSIGTGGKMAQLPHLVLNRCTQPFECVVTEEKNENLEVPYLALLLFYEEEFPVLQQGRVEEMFTLSENNTAFFPKEYKSSEKDTSCCFMDISMDLFWNIAPRLTELPFLVHGRKVNPELKCLRGNESSVTDIKSVVVCNRIPEYGTQQQPARNMVCLVSLEGCGKALKEKQSCYEKIRLPVLYHWEFTAVKDTNADVGLEQVCTKGMGTSNNSLHGDILANGYTPLPHKFREGSRLVSFYRGPLVPKKTVQEQRTVDSPDGLYRYDPELGLFDISYAAAWQLGTILALSDETVAKKILFMRVNTLQKLHRKNTKKLLNKYGVNCGNEINHDALNNQMLEYLKNYYQEGTEKT